MGVLSKFKPSMLFRVFEQCLKVRHVFIMYELKHKHLSKHIVRVHDIHMGRNALMACSSSLFLHPYQVCYGNNYTNMD